jgi:hypothetical protein
VLAAAIADELVTTQEASTPVNCVKAHTLGWAHGA